MKFEIITVWEIVQIWKCLRPPSKSSFFNDHYFKKTKKQNFFFTFLSSCFEVRFTVGRKTIKLAICIGDNIENRTNEKSLLLFFLTQLSNLVVSLLMHLWLRKSTFELFCYPNLTYYNIKLKRFVNSIVKLGWLEQITILCNN